MSAPLFRNELAMPFTSMGVADGTTFTWNIEPDRVSSYLPLAAGEGVAVITGTYDADVFERYFGVRRIDRARWRQMATALRRRDRRAARRARRSRA